MFLGGPGEGGWMKNYEFTHSLIYFYDMHDHSVSN